jgi:hypothetical protein
LRRSCQMTGAGSGLAHFDGRVLALSKPALTLGQTCGFDKLWTL